MATILEKLQEKYPYATADARNIAEALGMINGTGGRGSGSISDVMVKYVTVTFQPNGGSGEPFTMKHAANGYGVEFPACPFDPPEGKVFDYWCVSYEGSATENAKFRPGVANTNRINVDTTFYAIWKDA